MLHGRDAERAAIDALLASAEAGEGGVLVLRGGAGAGKSCLLDDTAERAEGFCVLRAAGIEAESELAYAGLHQLLWALHDRIATLQPAQAAALGAALGLEPGEEAARFLVSVATLTLLSEAAEERTIVCLIDDARWLDRPSLDTLLFVARRLAGERVALVATDLTDPSPFDVPGVTQLPVRPLDAAATAALLEELTGDRVAPQVAVQLAEGTVGNPLALSELARLMKPEQLSGAASLPDPVPIGEALARVMLERVHRLPEASRRLLLVAAAADSPDLGPILAAARRLDVPAGALDPAEAARLVRTSEGAIEFPPLVRAASYYDAPPQERRAAHRALAAVLDAAADADRRAWHLAAAAVEPDEDVARELEGAAERARRRGALAAVAVTLRRAAELTPDAQTRGRRLAAAGRAAFVTGQGAAAEALLTEADRLLEDPVERAQTALTLGEVVRFADPVRSIDIQLRGADAIVGTHPTIALDLLVAAAATVSVCRCGDAEGIERRADALADGRGDPAAVAYVQGCMRLALRGLEGGDRLQIVIPSEPVAQMPVRRLWIGLAAAHPAGQVRLPEALHFLARAAAESRAHGWVGRVASALLALCYGELLAGRFAAAEADAAEALELARADGRDLSVCTATAILALLAGIQGRADDCRALAADAAPRWMLGAGWIHHALGLWARGMLLLGAGDPEGALEHLWKIRPGGPMEQPWVTPLATLDYVEAAQWAGRTEEARAAARTLRVWTRAARPAWGTAGSALCVALTADDVGRAEEAFQAALRAHERLERQFMRARTQLLYGELLRRNRRRVEAREQLRPALHTFDHLRAEPWSTRARRELRASGLTLNRQEPSAREMLTPQELQIARFVARGGTNKEVAAQLFLSPRTVGAHLRSIFRKLNVATRTELAQLDFEGDEPTPNDR